MPVTISIAHFLEYEALKMVNFYRQAESQI